MEVIALSGAANRGKSETINVVYQLMLQFGYNQIPHHFRVLGDPIQKDFIDILEKKRIKIGIVSMGDYAIGADSLAHLLDYLNTNGCVKTICACTKKPGTERAVKAYSPHVFVNKNTTSIDSEQRIKNGEDAEKIYKMI